MCTTLRTVFMLAALIASAGCDSHPGGNAQPAGDTAKIAETPPGRAVSPEEARAAQLLSLSGGAIEQSSGYAGSLECAASLALFVQTIENSPLIDQTQADALRRARRLFNERAKTEGLAEGKSPSAVDAAITRATDNATDDPARSSRTAIACIRQLAGEAR
jgi:hypothetical protein